MTEFEMTLFTVVVSVFTAGFGLVLGHFLSNKQEAKRRRTEKRIEYLIQAFRCLERGAEPKASKYSASEFESAISDIQFFGNKEQVELAYRFCENASRGDGSLLQDLLENIRCELRNELDLPKEELPKIVPFRINHK